MDRVGATIVQREVPQLDSEDAIATRRVNCGCQ